MTSHLRWGFLGSGWIANEVAKDFALAGIPIRAVGARTLESADALADQHDIPNRHASYAALVNDPEVDIVYINTIHPLHHEHALLALNAGKHVLLEKPFTINAREAKEIQELAAAKGLFVMEAMWTRFLPAMDAIFEVINNGTLGEIDLLVADHSQYLPHIARLAEHKLGGGALLDLGIYPISLAHRIFGNPQSITARATLTDQKVDGTTSMIFEYANGAHASMTACFLAAGPVTASVIGTEARIDIAGSFYAQSAFTVTNKLGEVIDSYDHKILGEGRQYQALHVEKCIAEGLTQSPIMSVSETVEIMAVMDQIRAQVGVVYAAD